MHFLIHYSTIECRLNVDRIAKMPAKWTASFGESFKLIYSQLLDLTKFDESHRSLQQRHDWLYTVKFTGLSVGLSDLKMVDRN